MTRFTAIIFFNLLFFFTAVSEAQTITTMKVTANVISAAKVTFTAPDASVNLNLDSDNNEAGSFTFHHSKGVSFDVHFEKKKENGESKWATSNETGFTFDKISLSDDTTVLKLMTTNAKVTQNTKNTPVKAVIEYY